MTLFHAILGFGFFLLLLGATLLSGMPIIERGFKAFPRNRIAGITLFGAGAAWFIWNVAHLSKADEIGFISNDVLFFVFIAIAILSIPFVPDFLAVRGLSIVYLLTARATLDIGWLDFSTPQRMLNAAVYVGVVFALIIGASPYKLHDYFDWLFDKRSRSLLLGGVLGSYGIALVISAFQI